MVAPLRPRCISSTAIRLMAANRPREALVEYQALLAMNPQDLGRGALSAREDLRGPRGQSQGAANIYCMLWKSPRITGKPNSYFWRSYVERRKEHNSRRQETRALIENFQSSFGQIRTGSPQDHRGPGRSRRALADDAARRRPLPDHRHAGHARRPCSCARSRARSVSRSSASSSRRT